MLALAAAGAAAQTTADPPATPARSLTIVPAVSAMETYTSNVALTSGPPRSDLITSVTPSVRITSNSGRVQGHFDYALSGLVYARDSDRNELQNSLSASGVVEAIENWAFLDAAASVTRQAVSAFGTQSADPTRNTGNQTDVAVYNVSPYVRGRLAGVADYEVRASYSATRADSQSSFDSSTKTASARLSGATRLSALGWNTSASHQVTDYRGSGSGTTDRARVGLDYAVTPELKLSLNGGRELNDLLPPEQQRANTYGAGFAWRPSERTNVTADTEHRAFGNSHNIRLSYRTARTAFSYTDVRDISTGSGQPTIGSLGTAYDIFFQAFAAQQPDPVLRGQLVTDFLLKNGINPSSVVFGRILSSLVTLQRRQELSFGWLGLRDTLVVTASRNDARPIDQTNTAAAPLEGDDFAQAARIRQSGFGVDYSHRLTPQSSISAGASQSKTAGSETSQSSTLRSFTVGWNAQVGVRTSVSLGGRRSISSGGATDYTETAVIGSVRLQF